MAKEASREDGQVKLLGINTSPFVLRVSIAFAVKGIDYELVEDAMDLNTRKKSELLLQSNPIHKKMPVLIHNGKPICESMNIVQYIDEAWNTKAPSFMPKDPYDRAIARFWAAFVDDKLFPRIAVVLFSEGEQQQKAAGDSVANFVLIEEALRSNSCFSGKPYFGGDEIGFLDIALGGISPFTKAVEKVTDTVLIDREKMPLLNAWLDRFCESDGVKEVMPDPAKLHDKLFSSRAKFTLPSVVSCILF